MENLNHNARPANELFDARQAALQTSEEAKAALKTIDGEIYTSYRQRADEQFKLRGQQGGTVNFSAETPGYELKAVMGKKVEYDQDKLKEVMAGMSMDQINAMFTIDISMSEKQYSNLADPELKAKIDAARIVKYTDYKIELKKLEEPAA